MSGEVMRKIAIDGNVDTIEAFEKEFLHGTDESTETFDTLAKGYEVQHGRSDWDHVATGYAGVSGRNDELDDAASGSNAFGSYWESLGYNSKY